MPVSLIESYLALGFEIHQIYGLTESHGIGYTISSEDAVARVGSTGKPYFHTEARIVDDNGGSPSPRAKCSTTTAKSWRPHPEACWCFHSRAAERSPQSRTHLVREHFHDNHNFCVFLFRSRWIEGTATFTMTMSRPTIAMAAHGSAGLYRPFRGVDDRRCSLPFFGSCQWL